MAAQIKLNMSGVQPLIAEDESSSVAEGLAWVDAGNSLKNSGQTVMQYFKNINQDQATADMSIEYSKKTQDLLSKPYVTSSEAIAMGAEDTEMLWATDSEGVKIEKQVAIEDILPEVLKQQYDKLTQEFGSGIAGSGARQEWTNRRKVAAEELYTRLSADRNQAVFSRTVEKWDFAINEAKRSGDYTLALSMVQNHPDPNSIVVEEEIQKIYQTEELNVVNNALQQEDIGKIDQLVAFYQDPNTSSEWGEPEQTSMLNMLQSKKSQLTSEADYNPAIQQALLDYELTKNDSSYSVDQQRDSLLRLQQTMLDQGDPTYFGKTFFATQAGDVVALMDKQTRRDRITNEFMENGVRVGSLSTEEKNFLEEGVTEAMALAVKTGDPNTISSTISTIVTKSEQSNWIPKDVESRMAQSNSAGVSPGELRMGAELYGKYISTGNHALLGTLPPSVVNMNAMLWARQQGNQTLEQAHAQILANQKETSPELIKNRGDRFKAEYMDEKKLNEAAFIDKWKDQPWGWFTTAPPPPDRMRFAFDNLTQQFVEQGVDIQVAQTTSWSMLVAANQPTKVNGQQEWVRGAPEYVFQSSTEAVRGSLDNHIKNTYAIESNKVSIRPPIGASSTAVPYYHLYVEGPMGVPTPIMDSNGVFQVWVPDGNEIQAMDEKIKQDKVLELDRSRGRGPRSARSARSRTPLSVTNKNKADKERMEKEAADASRVQTIEDRSRPMAEQRRRQQLAEDML